MGTELGPATGNSGIRAASEFLKFETTTMIISTELVLPRPPCPRDPDQTMAMIDEPKSISQGFFSCLCLGYRCAGTRRDQANLDDDDDDDD